jgi:hypothetical protein
LEFIEIKKEIEDELRTIDLKFKNNNFNNNPINKSMMQVNQRNFFEYKNID